MKVHGCHPFGNAKARAVVWNFPDQIPQHREPLYGTRPDLSAKYPARTPTRRRSGGCRPCSRAAGQERGKDKLYEKFPLIMTSGRLVEYEGGGEETRSNPWLAELQQEMFVEINPKVAADRGVPQRRPGVGHHPDRRPAECAGPGDRAGGPDTVFLPFHFSGRWQGADMLAYYPGGAHPIVRGEAVNTGTTYGYDSRDDDAGNQDHDLQHREGMRGTRWHE
jgi:formate dehydrogenase major subunit